MPSKPIRIVIVDDSALIQQMLQEMLKEVPDIEVAGVAGDPYEAREIIKQVNPDVVTLDIEMPKMDGIEFLEKIMRLRPMPVIMLSSLTQKGADATIRALELGAVDYIAKASSDSVTNYNELREELIRKIRHAASTRISTNRFIAGKPHVLTFDAGRSKCNLIAMGASTGGVEALCSILTTLPANLPPIVITQHMPPRYTTSFAKRLDSLCALHVKEASHQERLESGTAYIAPGGRHLSIKRQGNFYTTEILDTETVSGHRPSVDVLFTSVAHAAHHQAVGVILTGMGVDGAAGLKLMREAGAITFGQNEESCVVYGMPRAAMRLGAVMSELPLPQIAAHMLSACYIAPSLEKKNVKHS